MAKGPISQEILDAIMQEMVGTYEVSEAEFAKLVPGPSTGPSTSPTRSHDRSSRSSSRARTPTRQRSRSPHNRHRDQYSCSKSPDSSSSEEFCPPERSRNARRQLRRAWNKGQPIHPSFEEALDSDKKKELLAERDSLSKLGYEVIRWSGFHTLIGNHVILSKRAQSLLKKGACANVIPSFKSQLKPELRAHCYTHVGHYEHPALQKPDLDDAFYELLVEKGAVADKLGFSEVINPLDKYLLSLQLGVLKCAQPMFVACSEYDLNVTPRRFSRAKLVRDLENNISLCRKTLVLLGMTYASASAFRQNKILEAVGLRDVAPKPSDFPNLEDSLLFGKEYMAKLKEWLEKSKHPVEVTYGLLSQEEKRKQAMEAKITTRKGPRVADPVALSMIDYLLEYTMKNCRLKGTQKGKPQFWFMFDESTYEYKYYRLKLLEMQKLKQATRDSEVQANAYQRSPEDLANESVRAMILARKIAAAKKKFQKVIPVRKKKKIISTKGTQTELAIPPVQKSLLERSHVVTVARLPHRVTAQEPPSSEPHPISNVSCTSKSSQRTENPKSLASEIIVEPKFSIQLGASELDAETKETADNLARFLVDLGPELDGFNLDVVASNPEFWFVKQKQSPAYQYFCKKLSECRKASGLLYDPLESYNRREAVTQGADSKGAQSCDPKPCATKPQVTESSKHREAATQGSKSNGSQSCSHKSPATKSQVKESSDHGESLTQSSQSKGSQSSLPKPPVAKPPVIEIDDSDCEIIEPEMRVARASVPQEPAICGRGSQDSKTKQPTLQDEPLVSYCSEDENSDSDDPSLSNPPKSQEPPVAPTQDGEPSQPVVQAQKVFSIDQKAETQHLQPRRYLKPHTPLPQGPVPLPPLHTIPQGAVSRSPLYSLPQGPVPLPPPPPSLPPLPMEPPPPLPKEPEPQDTPPRYTNPQYSLPEHLQFQASVHQDVKPVHLHPSNSETYPAMSRGTFELPYIKSEKLDLECEYSGRPSVDASPWIQSSRVHGLELVTEEEPSQSLEEVIRRPAESRAPEEAMQSASPNQSPLHQKRGRSSNGTNVSPKRLCPGEEPTAPDRVGIVKSRNGRPVEAKKETKLTEQEVDFQARHIKEEPSFGWEEGEGVASGDIAAASEEDRSAGTGVHAVQRVKK